MQKLSVLAGIIFVVSGYATNVYADASNLSDFTVNGSINVQYRADRNSNSVYGSKNETVDGSKNTLLLNMNQRISNNFDIYARFSYRSIPQNLIDEYAADYALHQPYHGAIDQYGVNFKNANWNYKLGAQSMKLGGTGLLYDDGRWVGKYLFNDALNVTGKIGVVDVQAIAAKSNYQTGISNDKIYYLHGSIPVNKSTFGLGFAHVDYGTDTAASQFSQSGITGLNYYSFDYGYKLADDLFFNSEVSRSSAANYNKGINFTLFHIIDPKNNMGVSWYRVEEQADIKQNYGSDMTTQWANTQGISMFFNHKITKNITFSVYDCNMKTINHSINTAKGGMPNNQNTFNVGLTYSF